MLDGYHIRPPKVRLLESTGQKAVAEKLKGMGYEVTGEADAKPIEDMKVDELKAYAAENNIDLGEATKKADILKIIQEAEANK